MVPLADFAFCNEEEKDPQEKETMDYEKRSNKISAPLNLVIVTPQSISWNVKQSHEFLNSISHVLKINTCPPGRCGSVGWALSCKLRCLRFSSQSEHKTRLWVWSPTKECTKKQPTNVCLSHRCFSTSLSPFLPFSLKPISMSLDEDLKKKKISAI